MLRIFVIDDDENIRTIYRTILECESFEVEEAADGHAGSESFLKKSCRPDHNGYSDAGEEGIETI
ncbi:MAG: hypothetical protein KAR13_04850 [Desulfobulbaceae bacterium]|nr:hypothetical protein [Desulfobulbaceae bacterium]